MLKGHVRLGLKTDASTENVGQGGALLGESVDHGGAWGSQRSLEHVAEDAEDAVEVLVLAVIRGFPLDTRHHLGNNDEVNDEGRSQERVLADVEQTETDIVSHDGKKTCQRAFFFFWTYEMVWCPPMKISA